MATTVTDPNKPVVENMAIKPTITTPPAMPKTVPEAQKIAPAGVTVTKTADTGLLTATGGYNPRTGGIETINPNEQVNTGIYSAQAKADLAKKYGLTGSVSQDAFDRDPTTGALSIKPEYTKGVTPVAPVAKTTVGLPVDNTKPHMAGDVWNAQTGNWELPGQTGEDQKAQSWIDTMYKENSFSQEQKDWFNSNIFKTPQDRLDFYKKTPDEQKSYLSNISNANILARDAKLTEEYRKSSSDIAIEQAKRKAALDEAKAKSQLDAQINNFSVVQGSAGRLQSRNLQNAISEQISLGRRTYEDMMSTNDEYIKQLADRYQYENTMASNDFNDMMNKLNQDQQNKIEALKKTGALQTQGGLVQAKDFISSTLAAADVAMNQYAYKLSKAATDYKAFTDAARENNKFSKEMTEASGGDFLLNAQGGIMMDAQGQPLKKDTTKKIADTIMDNMGNVTILYEDGTFSAPQKGIGKKEVEKPVFIDTAGGKQQFVFNPETGTYQPTGEIIKAPVEKVNERWASMGDGMLYNSVTGEIKSAGKVASTVNPSINQSLLDTPDGTKVSTGRTQCGEFVNDVLGIKGLFKDSIEQKMSVATDREPTIGGAVVFSSAGKYSKYGHVGIVIAEDENSITVKSSNWDGDDKITTEKVRKDSPMIQGYYAPKVASGGLKDSYIQRIKMGALTPSEYTDIQKTAQLEGWLPEYNEALKKGVKSNLTPTQQKSYEALVDDITKSSSYTNMGIFQNGISAVKSGLSQGNGLGDIEAINAFQRMVDPGATVREGDVSLIQSAIPLTGKYSWDYIYQQAKQGAKLPDEVRKQLEKASVDLYNSRAKTYNDSAAKIYKQRAAGIGVDETLVPGLNFQTEKTTAQENTQTNITPNITDKIRERLNRTK